MLFIARKALALANNKARRCLTTREVHCLSSILVSPSKPKSRRLFPGKSLSTSTSEEANHKPSSLSSRLSFVFDQIDAIEKRHSEQDETLERIRAWRQSKHPTKPSLPEPEPSPGEEELSKENGVVELVHPWPEWMELMERLVQQNYFDHRRHRDDDEMVQTLGIDAPTVGLGEEEKGGLALFQDFRAVQNAFLNFGKDRFDILRSLSRNDIQILVGHGCPATDRKVVFSGKLLRKRVHLDEGDVCSSCSLRNSCEKAFLLTNKEDEARTLDLMRILFTYGFDPMNGTVASKDLLKKKAVKNVVRKLLHEIVKLSSVPIDPNLTPPVIKKAPPKVKQPPPPPKRRVGRDDIEMKKGDWLCPKCDFMNFAKNTICLQCDAKRPKRQLLPGEWECPECNFLNYRRNMACFHCDCKRPPEALLENKTQETRPFTDAQTEKVVKRDDVSNAWNFDFDDDESDGAEVAAFEYADSTRKKENSPGEGLRYPEDERGHLPIERSELDRSRRPGVGFDDFDDEDDIDSYEIDETGDKGLPVEGSQSSFASNMFSEDEHFSESMAGSKGGSLTHHNSRNKRGNRGGFSKEDDLGSSSDDEISVNSRWKSSHVASLRRGPPSRKPTFGSDDEFGLDSDMESDGPIRQGQRYNGGREGFKGNRNLNSHSDSDDERDSSYSGNRWRGTRGRARGGRGGFGNAIDSYKGSRGREGRRGSKGSGFDSDDEGYRGKREGSGGRMGSRRGGFDDEFDRKSSRGRGSGRGRGKQLEQIHHKDTDFGDFRNSRRIIER